VDVTVTGRSRNESLDELPAKMTSSLLSVLMNSGEPTGEFLYKYLQ
jgi:hypothetical protein